MPRKRKPMRSRANKGTKASADAIQIIGSTTDVKRTPTGLASFDFATHGGIPQRAPIEIYGYQGVGKSSLAYFFGGVIAAPGNLALVDFEGYDPGYLKRSLARGGFSGKVYIADLLNEKGEPVGGEKTLDNGWDKFIDEDCQCLILDSVTSLPPGTEMEGETSEAFVGQRARIMAKFMRFAQYSIRRKAKPSNVIVLNHIRHIIGGRGTTTPGGEAIKDLSLMRLRLMSGERFDDGTYTIRGRVEKLRWRTEEPRPDEFNVFMVPGYGVHVGLTAVWDAIEWGFAKKERTITLGGKSYGFLSKMVEQRDDDDLFQPFIEATQ